MAKSVQKITLSQSRDIPFNKLVLSQSNVRRIKAGVSIEELARLPGQLGQHRSVVGPEGDDEAVLPSTERGAEAHDSCSSVAQSPCAWSRATSDSAFSLGPEDTTALPFVWTSYISFSAFSRG